MALLALFLGGIVDTQQALAVFADNRDPYCRPVRGGRGHLSQRLCRLAGSAHGAGRRKQPESLARAGHGHHSGVVSLYQQHRDSGHDDPRGRRRGLGHKELAIQVLDQFYIDVDAAEVVNEKCKAPPAVVA